jgi:GDP-L-fucose synthase
MNLASHTVCVTGGAGFLGSCVVQKLAARGVARIVAPPRAQYDLTRAQDVERLFADHKPSVVFHLAASVGGIGANSDNPGLFFYENALMGIHVVDAARRHGVDKLIVAGTICSYPKFAPIPFREDDLWNGYPEETNAPYGIAKKSLLVLCQAYKQQYGLNSIFLMPVNLYGPRDNFDLHTSHVIPALIRKCVEAQQRGEPEIVCWGDGSPTREFLYVDDCAEALVLAAEKYDAADPVNLGSGCEISILSLASTIARLTGYQGRLVWDAARPNGQPRRRLDTSRALARFGFQASTPLEEGLRRTIEWYRAQ